MLQTRYRLRRTTSRGDKTFGPGSGNHEVAHRIAVMCRRYNPGVQEKREQLNECIHVEEHDDLFSPCTCLMVSRSPFWPPVERDAPTAVYLLLICRIMIIVMRIATMCTKHVAV